MRFVASALLLSAIAGGQPTEPALLGQAMRGLPHLRLLDQSIDLVGGYTVEELTSFGYWPPTVTTGSIAMAARMSWRSS
jgi:hypothetical protein